MSKLKNRTRLENKVALITVPLVQLRAQAVGEAVYAQTGGNMDAVRAVQSGCLDQDYAAVHVLHKNAKGKVVAKSTINLGAVDGNTTVSVVDRSNQSALRALSEKAEKLVAHHARLAERHGWHSETRFTIAEGRDVSEVMKKHKLSDGEPYDFEGESYAKVRPGRDPAMEFDMQRAKRKR